MTTKTNILRTKKAIEMKSFLFSILTLISVLGFSQVPSQINYQGVARNSVGNVLPNRNLSLRLSVRDGSTSGTVVYSEIRNVSTNSFGLFTVAIGSNGATNVTGSLSTVNWSTGAKFLQVEIDPSGGSSFLDLGAAQLLSVPFAFYSETAKTAIQNGSAGGDLSGNYPDPVIKLGAITTPKLADNSVTTIKITDASITSVKLADNAVTTSKVEDGAITASKIAPGVIPISLPPNGSAGGDLTGTYPNPVVADNAISTAKVLDASITNPKLADDAVSTTKIQDGAVTSSKIAPGVIPTSLPPGGNAGGDLTGTYPNPTISDNAISTSKVLDASITNPKLVDGAVTTSKVVDGAITASKIAPGVIPTSLPPGGTAGGDLTGTYPNPTITANAIDNSKLASNSVTTTKISDASVTAAKLAPGVIPTSLPPNGIASGDLSGSYPNPAVSKLLGITINSTPPLAGEVLKFNGTEWAPGTDIFGSGSGSNPTGPAGGDLSGSYPNPNIASGAITIPKIANGAVITPKIADDAVTTQKIMDLAITTPKLADASVTAAKLAPGVIPTSLPPSGTAGGDLSGTYPNPTVTANAINSTKLANNAVTTTKVADASITAAKLAPGVIPISLPPSGVAGGDLSGSYPNPAVNKIQGVSVNNTLPVSGQVLKFNGTEWVPGTDDVGSSGGGNPTGPAGGDLAGTYPNPTIATSSVTSAKVADGAIGNLKIADNAITTSKILDASVTSAKLAPGVIPTSLPPNGTAGGDLTGTYPNPTIGNNAITTSKISDASVTIAKLAPGVIPTSLPPSGTAGGDLSGSYPNPVIADNTISSTKLLDNSVTTSKITDASVTSAKIAPGVIPTSLPPSGTAGGDLSGSYPNPAVNKIRGVNINGTLPVAGQVLKFDGTEWIPGTDDVGSGGGGNPTGPAGGDLTGTYPNPTIGNNAINTAKILDASVTAAKLAPGVIPTSLPPTGSAGGDLTGSYPNPTIATNAITTTKITDASVTAAKLAPGVIPTTLPPTGSAGGDLTGTYPNPTITNNAVTTSKILDASVTAAKLAPGVIPSSLPPSGSAGGDLSGSYPNPFVTKIQGFGVSNTTPVNGQVLKYNGSQWIPDVDNSGGLTLPYLASASNASSLFSLTNQGTGNGFEGINSTTNANAFGVVGKITSAAPGSSASAIRGINSGVGSQGNGVWGSHDGYGIGVNGTSASGNGVQGSSVNGNGLLASSTNASAGYFDISNASNAYDAFFSYTVGSGSGGTAISEQGNGLWGITYSPFGAGVLGYNTGGGEAIVGQNISNSAAAVVGRNNGTFAAVQGISSTNSGTGILAEANVGGATGGNALVASLEGTNPGNTAVFKTNGSNVARIDHTGKGFFNGGTQMSGADVAEYFDIEGARSNYEPGDVLVISQNSDRTVEKSSEAYSTLVAGVFATRPGIMLTEENAETDRLEKMVPMGVIGVIPTKVCLQGGSIKRGDLIVTSSISGVAMKADPDKVKPGQVIGKALQDFNENTIGLIKVLVSVK